MARQKRKRSPKQEANMEQKRLQRETLEMLQEEIDDLHQISLYVMDDRGILPPLYGGTFLGEDREVIPLWGWADNSAELPEIGVLLLRIMEGVEPNPDLDLIREELEIVNDWPISELLDMMEKSSGNPVEGAATLKDLLMFVMLTGNQIAPAPGYDHNQMIEAIVEGKPFAVFPIIPTQIEDETLVYQWDRLDDFRAEIVYAETPQLLETSVWNYRLRLALEDEVKDVQQEGLDPNESLIAVSVPELAGIYESLAMHAVRLYGSTSPLRARQQELDILREENGDLVALLPLKPEIEPVSFLAEDRRELNAAPTGVLLQLPADSEMMRTIWPKARVSKLYCIRVRHGNFVLSGAGQLRANGFSKNPVFEWIMADSLPELYWQVHLFSLYELLSVGQFVDGQIKYIPKPD